MAENPKPSRIKTIARAAVKLAGDRRKLPLLGVFPIGDYALPFLPNQVLMTAVALLHPRNWFLTAIVFSLGSAIGAVLTGFAIQGLQSTIFSNPSQSGDSGAILNFIRQWGVVAVAALALLPVPPRTAVLVTAFSGINPFLIGAAVAAGRIVPATIICYIAARAPEAASRFPASAQIIRSARDFAQS